MFVCVCVVVVVVLSGFEALVTTHTRMDTTHRDGLGRTKSEDRSMEFWDSDGRSLRAGGGGTDRLGFFVVECTTVPLVRHSTLRGVHTRTDAHARGYCAVPSSLDGMPGTRECA